MSNFLKLIISLALCQLAGVIGTFFTLDSIPLWYASLNKPAFNPPSELFGPVWIILYFMMGVSLFLIWKEGLKNKDVKAAFVTFMIQLGVNVLWSVVFFGMQSVSGGLIVIIVLWILILITIMRFIRISVFAGILMLPYLLWVSFAAVLNFYFLILN